MARDQTLQEEIETILHSAYGSKGGTGEIAQVINEMFEERVRRLKRTLFACDATFARLGYEDNSIARESIRKVLEEKD